MNKSDKDHLSRVAALGCVACRVMDIEDSPASVHHIRHGQGMSQRAPHKLTIPLCPPHHQTGGYGVAIHAGKDAFERTYGTELELLKMTYELLGEPCPI